MEVYIEHTLLNEMASFAKEKHPREMILLLRGNIKGEKLIITDYLFPPRAQVGYESAVFPTGLLPIDFSIIGTIHSHPSGVLDLSVTDQHSFYGMISLLIGYPYRIQDVIAFGKSGSRIPLIIN